MIETFKLVFWAIVGGVVGLTAADIDLAPPLPLKHRSAWTHGPVVPVLAWLLVRSYPSTWPFAAAFLFTYSLHLLFDMFPNSWRGSALINLYPIKLSLPPLLSFLYLLAGVLFALVIATDVVGWPVLDRLAWLTAF